MGDPILDLFAWITPVLQEPSTGDLPLDAIERRIFEQFRDGWGRGETAALLRGLTASYGEAAGATIEKVLARRIRRDWADAAARGHHGGRELDDFLHLLWDPLPALGFEFTRVDGIGVARYRVTRCPVHEIAKATGLHRWMYHLACASDLSSTTAFCPRIRMQRPQVLVTGDECCEFTYEMER